VHQPLNDTTLFEIKTTRRRLYFDSSVKQFFQTIFLVKTEFTAGYFCSTNPAKNLVLPKEKALAFKTDTWKKQTCQIAANLA
jgi:hypothetical protein